MFEVERIDGRGWCKVAERHLPFVRERHLTIRGKFVYRPSDNLDADAIVIEAPERQAHKYK